MASNSVRTTAANPQIQARKLQIVVAGLSAILVTLLAVCIVFWKRPANAETAAQPAPEKKRTVLSVNAPVADVTPQATFIKPDTKRGGAWKKDLGKEGYVIFNRK